MSGDRDIRGLFSPRLDASTAPAATELVAPRLQDPPLLPMVRTDPVEQRRVEMDRLMTEGDGEDMVVSSLDRPRAQRKRTASTEPAVPEKKKPRTDSSSELKTVTAADRAAEFAHEGFVVSNGLLHFCPLARPCDLISLLGLLFCKYCRKEFTLKLSSIKDHVKVDPTKGPSKHSLRKIAVHKEKAKQADLVSFVEVPSPFCKY